MPGDQQQTAALIAAKRAEVLAKLAKFKKPEQAPSPAAASSSSASPTPSRATSGSRSPGPGSQEMPQVDAIQKKIAEAKARLANSVNAMPRPSAGGIHTPGTEAKKPIKPQIATDQSGHIDLKAMMEAIPRRDVATAKANLRQATTRKDTRKTPEIVEKGAPVTNPYLAHEPTVKKGAIRKPRQLKFAQHGKYIQQAQEIRRKAQLQKLKEEIAESVKKAGMEIELDITDKSLKKEPPPIVEWWDAPFLPNKTYEDMDQTPVIPEQLDQLVTLYVHHPIPIKPPNEQNETPIVRSLMLTKKERKKLRRQRRQEAQKEKQDKIRLGLLPPDPPKVKISNLMRVLGNEAIQDPTKIEAKVRREMEQRQKQHELANEQRKLTPEERRAKIMTKVKEDQKMSNEVAVFKIKNCSHPKHRYKIEVNAQQHHLTGMVIIHPKCHLVIVEGGPKSIKAYKKLMLRRIDWNDMPPPKGEGAMDIDKVEDNRCFLVWEGQVKDKAFKRFTWRTFESEKMAREELSKWNVEHYWDAAVMHSDEELAARQPQL